MIIYIDGLFGKRMQEFVDFIEDTLEVTDQVDVNKDHVIDAFYREHNTLNKMNENFRLLEYKRKVYLKRKREKGNSQSPSPEHNKISRDDIPSPNKFFKTNLRTASQHLNSLQDPIRAVNSKFMNITHMNKSINVQDASTKFGSLNDSSSLKNRTSRALGS